MQNLVVTQKTAQEAQRLLQDRIGIWLQQLLKFPGYSEWKNRQIIQTLIEGHATDIALDPLPDFQFPKEIEQQINLIQGYHAILSCLYSLRECEFYFRRYPFGGRDVSREAHLRNCCELFLSRVYQFQQRWTRQLKWLNRRTKPKGIPVDALEREFRARFGNLLDERHKLHHDEEYSDVQLKAIGLGTLLSLGDDKPDWMRLSRGSYLRIRREWVQKVKATADQLDMFAGVIATLMLERCHFLVASND